PLDRWSPWNPGSMDACHCHRSPRTCPQRKVRDSRRICQPDCHCHSLPLPRWADLHLPDRNCRTPYDTAGGNWPFTRDHAVCKWCQIEEMDGKDMKKDIRSGIMETSHT